LRGIDVDLRRAQVRAVGGCVEVAGRLYTVVARPNTRSLGELGVDTQVRYPDGPPLMWVAIQTDEFVVVKTTAALEPGIRTLVVTVNADGEFAARAEVVSNRVEVAAVEAMRPSAGLAGRPAAS
jgi:hypothetical protein